jgi:hypothetical protein
MKTSPASQSVMSDHPMRSTTTALRRATGFHQGEPGRTRS